MLLRRINIVDYEKAETIPIRRCTFVRINGVAEIGWKHLSKIFFSGGVRRELSG